MSALALAAFAAAGCTAWNPRAFGRCASGWPSTSRRGMTAWIGWMTTSKRDKKRRAPVTRKRHRSAVIELPNDREIVITREFGAPIALVFDVFTKRDRAEMALMEGEELKVCTIDLRVGGNYHHVFVGDDGTEASFRGTFLEIEPPTRIVATWLYNGWPDAEAVESIELHETHGVTTLTYRLAFRDQAGRDHMTNYDGILANFDNVEDLLSSRLDPRGTVSG
jgi:uncharacterized protein YndB with AHSA1/START domain